MQGLGGTWAPDFSILPAQSRPRFVVCAPRRNAMLSVLLFVCLTLSASFNEPGC